MHQRNNKIINRIKEVIFKTDPTAQAFLYGSRARGTAKKDSDWDILILINQENNYLSVEQKFRHNLYDIEIDFGEVISTYVVSKHDWETKYVITPFYTNIKKEGIKLWMKI